MAQIIVFGGTTEGRLLEQALGGAGISALVCVATEVGAQQLNAYDSVEVRVARLDQHAMEELFTSAAPIIVVDATHPYAAEVSANIVAACKTCGIEYLRVYRPADALEGLRVVRDLPALVAYLNKSDDTVFVSMGAKHATELTAVNDFEKRLWVRLLPAVEGIGACLAAGYPSKHLMAMQGPFSYEMNVGMYKHACAKILVTKASGKPGGFGPKIEAARDCGMEIVVLARPCDETGVSVLEAIDYIKQISVGESKNA